MGNRSRAPAVLLLTMAMSTTFASPSLPAVGPPRQINYQGRLTDTGGTPVDGTVQIVFALHTSPSGGTALWSETHPSVQVSGGIHTVLLGSITPLLETYFSQPLYVAVTVGADTEMTPRQALVSAPHAMRSFLAGDADTVDGQHAAAFAASAHDLDGRYFTETESDANYFNVTCDFISVTTSGTPFVVSNGGSGGGAAFIVVGNAVYGETSGVTATAVKGEASATTGTNYGGHFSADGLTGQAVYGEATSTATGTNYGGNFIARGTTTRAVSGVATSTAAETNSGGYFTAAGTTARAVYGEATFTTTSCAAYGGYFVAHGAQGVGVYGEGKYGGKFFKTDTSMGGAVLGSANSTDGFGVEAWSQGPGGTGVYAWGQTADFLAAGPGADYATVSSIPWKRNVKEIEGALDTVLKLRGVTFDWDEEHGGSHDMGFIAEEVGAQVPEVVAFEDDGVYARAVDYGALTARDLHGGRRGRTPALTRRLPADTFLKT